MRPQSPTHRGEPNDGVEPNRSQNAATRAASAIATKQLQQRDALWPDQEPNLWDRKANKGFATIPKTMALILRIMDEMSKGKLV